MRLGSVAAVRGFASRMCAVSGITSPVGSVAKLGVAWMDAASSGKPLSRRLPIIVSCSKTSTRSQNSTSIRISRTTKYEPPAVHDGSPAAPGWTQTSEFMSRAEATEGFAIPSMNPSRFRGTVPAGRAGEANPSIRQLICMPPRVFLAMSRSACSTVSIDPALSWTIRSPPHCAGSRLSLGNDVIVVSRAGRADASPYRSSNSVAPTPSVTVSPSGSTVGPSTPESDGGPLMPTGGGVPPAVRNLARSVSVWNRSVSEAWSSAVTSNETTAVTGVGPGRMPAWCLPWNGTAGSRPVNAAASAAAGAGGALREKYPAAAPPAPPATTPPATPPARPRRNNRRPGGGPAGSGAGSVEDGSRGSEVIGDVPRLGDRRDGGKRLQHGAARRVDRLPRGSREGRDGNPHSVRAMFLLDQRLQPVEPGVDGGEPRVAGGEQRAQQAEQVAGALDIGERGRERGAAAVVVVPGELELQGVFQDLV